MAERQLPVTDRLRGMRLGRRMRGVSLVELMVSMSIGLVLTGAVSAIYLNVSRARTDLDRVSQLTENARFAVDLMAEDLRHAGFYGPFVPAANARFVAAVPCTVAWNTLGWDMAASPPQLPAAMAALDDPATLPIGWDCLPNAVPGTDVITLRRVSETAVLPTALTTRNVPYVQASQCTTDPVPSMYSAEPSDFRLRNLRCEPAASAPVPVRQYITRTYYLARCNQCDPSDNIQTLKRVEMRDGALTVQSLAENVAALQLQYGFDLNGDGNVDASQTALNGVAGDPGDDWANVMTVRVNVLMQSAEAVTGPAADRTYDLGPGHEATVCATGRRCLLAASTVRLVNVAGRREQP